MLKNTLPRVSYGWGGREGWREGGVPLGTEDHGAHEQPRLAELEEGQQVHALVLALFQQRGDPAIITAQHTERMQVAHHPAHHARHARNRLEEY